MNRINFNASPSGYPDTDRGNLKLFYELELLKSAYETDGTDKQFSRYLEIMDVLGNRGHFVDFASDLKIDKKTRESDWEEYYVSAIQKPIPSPGKDEEKDAFMGRCISTLSRHDSDKEQSQIIAICGSTWRDSKKKNK